MLLKSIAKRVKSTKDIPLQEFIDTVELLGFTTESSAKFKSPDHFYEMDRSKYPYEIPEEEYKELLSKYPRIDNPKIGDVCVSGFDKYTDANGNTRRFPKYMIAVESIAVGMHGDKKEIAVKTFGRSQDKYVDLSSGDLNFLYEHGADKNAEEIVGERKKAEEKPDETVSQDTCGACGRRIHATINNRIMRHGWRGSIRNGQQVLYQGECVGWDTIPLEDSKEGIVKWKNLLVDMKKKCESQLEYLRSGDAVFFIQSGKNMERVDKTNVLHHKIMTEDGIHREEGNLRSITRDLEETEVRLSRWKRDFSRGLLKAILA